MELYTLDPTFHYNEVIEDFDSWIWTERYSAAGDVTVKVPDSITNRTKLDVGTFLALPTTKEVMLIDTHSIENGFLTATGGSLAAFLQQRIVRASWANFFQYYTLTGAPGWIATEVVKQMCIAGGLMASGSAVTGGDKEIIPNLALGARGPSAANVTIGVEYGTVYDGIKKICDSYDLGFSLFLDTVTDTSYGLKFKVYQGLDLTSDQSTNPAVIFESAIEALANVKELRSIAGLKNVAYAWAPQIKAQNYAVGTAFSNTAAKTATGFNRRTMMVLADDINDADLSTTTGMDELQKILDQRAKDALANNNYVRLTDGEIIPQGTYTYGTDYNLGDLIELRAVDNIPQDARVTEYIRTQDATGYKAYPTLSTATT